ncbi:MAG: single-stranded DNA-binding protein [Deltaproteobacteria bacterium]|nr:single-stranded DNA-binding protein [Deltaproteobacteria bacterium]
MTALLDIADELARDLDTLSFGAPVAAVYNPLVYARPGYAAYCDRYAGGDKEVLLVGMNPGPFGMAQTGVPFGHVELVRDWLGIDVPIGKPPREHPARPVEGFACPRAEVSGARLWGWARSRFGVPRRFFERFFVLNYCPLLFVEESGRNRTPDKLAPESRAALLPPCDRALAAAVSLLRPRFVVGIGRFAAERVEVARALVPSVAFTSGSIPHPSPANPAANRDWAGSAERALESLGVTVGEQR